MKTEKERIHYDIKDIKHEFYSDHIKYIYTIETHDSISSGDTEIVKEFKLPETLKEFIDTHGLTKKQLVDWLNQNFK